MKLLAELRWLRRLPDDFWGRCRSLAARVSDPDFAFDTAFVDIANFRLDMNQLGWVSKLVSGRLNSPIDTALARFKLGFLGSGTLR